MALKAIIDSIDELDDVIKEHYKLDEKSGKHVLDLEDLEGMPRIRALKDENAQSRIKNRELGKLIDTYKALGELDDLQAKLDRIPELEAAAAGNLDEEKISQLVEARIKTRLAPVERDKAGLAAKVEELTGHITEYQTRERTRSIHDEVRKAAAASKVLPEALEDALMLAERVFEVEEDGRVLAKDGVGCTPGIDPTVWLTELQSKRPHWWPNSQGGGAAGNNRGGGGGSNPWSAEHWNLTEQGRILTENRSRADQLAKIAGTTVGGPRPAARK